MCSKSSSPGAQEVEHFTSHGRTTRQKSRSLNLGMPSTSRVQRVRRTLPERETRHSRILTTPHQQYNKPTRRNGMEEHSFVPQRISRSRATGYFHSRETPVLEIAMNTLMQYHSSLAPLLRSVGTLPAASCPQCSSSCLTSR